MKKAKWLMLNLLIVATATQIEGQSYITAVGLRMGSDFGVTIQQRIISRFTVEGIVSTRAATDETTGTVLLEMHKPLISKRVNFYMGGGFHNRWLSTPEGNQLALRGVTAVAGAEMTLGRFNISWDFKPLYHLNATQHAYESETAISLRYVFIKKIKTHNDKLDFLRSNDPEKQKVRKQRLKDRKKKKRIRLREKKKGRD